MISAPINQSFQVNIKIHIFTFEEKIQIFTKMIFLRLINRNITWPLKSEYL